MDLDAAAEELYAGSPDDFVERRTALAAQARAAKDRTLVKQIGALRRPTRTAWLLNLLARESADAVAELLSLGASLQDAQRRMAGAELRQLSAERRRRVDQLAREAVRLGAAHGYPAPDAALQEVSQSLQAALADPAIGDQLRSGRMTAAVSYGGFGPSDLMAAMAASLSPAAEQPLDRPAEAAPQPEPQSEPVSEEDAAAAENRRRLAAQVERAEAAWEAARTALDEAESAANDATAHADELADRIEELRAELEQTVADEAAAREEARTARRTHQEARRAAAAAEQDREAALREQAEGG
jgi:hypothetical protein